LFGVDKDGSNLIGLTDFENVVTHLIDDLEDIPEEIIVGLNKRNPQIFDPYRLNIETGELLMLAENPGNIQSWMTDHNGKLRIASTTDGVNTSLLYRETEEDNFRTIITTNFKESINPLFFTFDNKQLYASSNIGRDKSAIILFDLEEGKEVKELFSHDEVDVQDLSYSRKRKVLTSISYTTDKAQRHFLDKESKESYEWLESKLGDYEIFISSSNKNEDIFIIRTYSDKSLGAYYLYDENKKTIEKIKEVAPWINEDYMADMKPIQYKSRDGLTINGYLTLPKNVKAKNLPVVVNPHGGPWYRDSWGYNPEVQLLANRGYAVLQMNFRGSTGYGRSFWEASFKQWGQNMQNDITDGVNWLIDQGIADPNKIAIYGASYGGYATLSGITTTPNLYACAIDYVGVSNLFTFMETIPPYWAPFLDMMHEMVGDPSIESDSLMMREFSPVFQVDKIITPLFVAQGANDPRVNKDESDQMVEALKKRNIDVEYMVKDNEGHGFHNEENKFEFYNAMEKFLEKHLKNNIE
jgi:dipeptidyl aminopeptidase/acylaminoacyl peptidase